MKKEIFVHDLKNGESFSDVFVINSCKFLEDKNGNTYADITIGDKTGSIKGKMWSDSLDKIDKDMLTEGELYVVAGSVSEYRGNLQVTIRSLTALDQKMDMEHFVRTSDHPIEELEAQLKSYLDMIENKQIKKFVEKIIYDEDVKERYFSYPAARTIHHDFYHGLVHHTVEMLDIALSLKNFYKELNYDILIAGIILHDIGKIEEFEYNGIQAELTKNYWLYGHLVLGILLVRSYYDDDIDPEDLEQIEHIILSHHGDKEYGSPVLPATPEAFVAAYVDRLSFKLKTSMNVLEQTPETEEMSAPAFFLDNTRILNTLQRSKNKAEEANDDEEDTNSDQLELV